MSLFTGVCIAQVDFGHRFFGEVVERKLQIFNNGPVDARYLLSYGTPAEMKSKLDDNDGQADPDDPYADLIMSTRQRVRIM